MAAYRPNAPFVVPFTIYNATKTTDKGVAVKTWIAEDGTYMGSFRTFGGTEAVKDGIYSVINTATLETWFTPLITASSRIVLVETGETYEVVGTPEDIERRHQFMLVKLKGVEADA